MNNLRKREGKIYVGEADLFNNTGNIRQALAECIIVRAEYLWSRKGFEYIAVSELFKGLEAGRMPPEYRFRQTESGFIAEEIDYRTGLVVNE